MLRPSTARGMPALGMAARGSVVAPRMASMAVSTVAGPVEQFTPMAPAPHSVSSAAAWAGEAPSRQLLSSSTVTMTSDGQIGSDLARRLQRLVSLVQRGHGLNDEQVHAGIVQGANLLGKGGAGFVEAGLAQRLKPHAERTDGAGNPGLAGLLLLQVLDGLAGQAHARRH